MNTLIFSVKKFVSTKHLVKTYKTFVQSILQYGVLARVHIEDQNRFSRSKRKALVPKYFKSTSVPINPKSKIEMYFVLW